LFSHLSLSLSFVCLGARKRARENRTGNSGTKPTNYRTKSGQKENNLVDLKEFEMNLDEYNVFVDHLCHLS
jgi:hypothetical protein